MKPHTQLSIAILATGLFLFVSWIGFGPTVYTPTMYGVDCHAQVELLNNLIVQSENELTRLHHIYAQKDMTRWDKRDVLAMIVAEREVRHRLVNDVLWLECVTPDSSAYDHCELSIPQLPRHIY